MVLDRDTSAALLAEFAHTGTFTPQTWAQVGEGLRQQSCAPLPALTPPEHTDKVFVFPLAQGALSRVLLAAAELAESGGMAAALEQADATRSLAALTTLPRLCHFREAKPPPGASPRQVLDHRIGVEGGGYLAMPAGEAVAALGIRRALSLRDGIYPLPPYQEAEAWVVVRRSVISAPGTHLTGIQAAYTHRGTVGADWLMECLRTTAAAMQPGPARLEWSPQH